MAGFTFEWMEWNWHDVAFVVSNVFGKKIYGILKMQNVLNGILITLLLNGICSCKMF